MTTPHPTTSRLYAALGRGITGQDPQGAFLLWLDGAGSLLGEVDDVVRDTDAGPGWSGELTGTGTHRVRWTGQLLGVVVPEGASDAEARQLIADRPAIRRGTPSSLTTAAQATLTGDRYVMLKERDGSAYRLTVTTFTSETPSPAATLAALQAAKPAGLVLTHLVVAPTAYAITEGGAAKTYSTLEAEPAQTYTQMEA